MRIALYKTAAVIELLKCNEKRLDLNKSKFMKDLGKSVQSSRNCFMPLIIHFITITLLNTP